jgi:Ca-activated chloride channel family protein
MTFADPLLLLGLALIVAATVAYAFTQRAGAGGGGFASPALAGAVRPGGPRRSRHLAIVLYALAAAALVVALARPQTTVAVPIEQATVMLVTDHSRSMAATDIAPSRLKAAQRAANRFLDGIPQDLRVGAVAFNQRARVLQVPTTDRAAVRGPLSQLEARGGTATGEGLALALAAVRQPVLPGQEPPPAAIVLLADGRASNGRDVLEVAAEAEKAGVKVHTVALGTSQGALPGGGTATSDEATLREVAERTGGTFATAADADELQAVYEDLGSQVSTREEQREVTAAFAGGALVLLLAGAGLSLLTIGRLP